MGLTKRVIGERAHTLGAPQPERRGPRQVIARYLNFNDKSALLQKFRNKRDLMIEGQQILLFSDYSAEVSRKRKMFSKICTTLPKEKKIYPGISCDATPAGARW